MNGYQLIEWYEKMKFSSIVDSKLIGIYEQYIYSNPSDNIGYKVYKEAVKKDFVQMMNSKYNSLQL